MISAFPSALPSTTPTTHSFSPFTDNGSTTLAISGTNYCLIASDTRLSEGYNILTRYQPHSFKLTENIVFSASGMYADTLELSKQLKVRIEAYEFEHKKSISVNAVAQLLQVMLYRKRFFPFYVFSVIAGLDDHGVGAVYSFDPVGSYEREFCRCGGSSASLIQPFLDSLVSQRVKSGYVLPLDEAKKIAKDAFTSATERQIYTGDYLELYVVTKDGVEVEKFDLKKD